MILVLGTLRQKDYEFRASLGHIMRCGERALVSGWGWVVFPYYVGSVARGEMRLYLPSDPGRTNQAAFQV